jgi:hypothetical protein
MGHLLLYSFREVDLTSAYGEKNVLIFRHKNLPAREFFFVNDARTNPTLIDSLEGVTKLKSYVQPYV